MNGYIEQKIIELQNSKTATEITQNAKYFINILAENERLTKHLESSVQLTCKEECNETEKLYGVYGEDNEGVPFDNPNKIFSDIKMAKEYAILQKGKIAWGIAPVYEIFPKTVYEKVKKIDVRE